MNTKLSLIGALALGLAACASPAALPTEVPVEDTAEPWTFSDYISSRLEASCESSKPAAATAITIAAAPLELGGALEGLTFAGGWHLTSDESGFGGLSGIEVQENGDLLTVSDQGSFVLIGMDNGTPNGTGTMARMRGSDGNLLSGKRDTDAEGLVTRNGVAFVSFERNHRILAFDSGGCGANARGVEVAKLPIEQDGKSVKENGGAEALSLNEAGELTFGYETGPANGAPIGTVRGDGNARFTADSNAPRGFAQVGRDELNGTLAELFRSYDPIRGNRNVIRIGDISARLTRPMAVDNFEGIALQEMPDGTTRIWIVSDDNFNKNQRTLLMAFDVAQN